MQAAEKQIESLRSKLKTQRAAAETLLASQTLPSTPSADQNNSPDGEAPLTSIVQTAVWARTGLCYLWTSCWAEELVELRRVVAFLQSKMAGLEKELHAAREQQASDNTERHATHEELQHLQERLQDAESSKAELITLVTEASRRSPASQDRLSRFWSTKCLGPLPTL